tara:strand:+ start:161 stop:361 length:201 start_codon:yes stop_codon:yes gene_type:complete
MDILDIIEEQYFKKIKIQKIINNNSLNNEKDNVKVKKNVNNSDDKDNLKPNNNEFNNELLIFLTSS